MPKDPSTSSKKGHKPYDATKRKQPSTPSQDGAHSSSNEAAHKHKNKKDRSVQQKPSHPFANSFVDPDAASRGVGDAVTASGSPSNALSPLKRLPSLIAAENAEGDDLSHAGAINSPPVTGAKKAKSSKKRRRERLRQSTGHLAKEGSPAAGEASSSLQLSTGGDETSIPVPAQSLSVAASNPSRVFLAASRVDPATTIPADQLFEQYKTAGLTAFSSPRPSASPDKPRVFKSVSLSQGVESSKSAALEKKQRQEEAQKAVLARSIQQAREDARIEVQQEMENEMAEMSRKIRELEAKVEEKEREVGEQIKAVDASKATIESQESVMERLKDATVCGVCFEHLNDPHILSCGHIACKSCLQSWFRTPGAYLREHPDPLPPNLDLSYHTKVCHVCRARIFNRPSRVYFAKDILEPLGFDAHIPLASQIAQAKAASAVSGTGNQAAQADEAETDPWSRMFPPDVDQYKLWDESDQIFRCNGCCSEVADGTCEGCGREFSVADPDDIPGIWAAGPGDGDGDEEMDGDRSDGFEVMDEREGMFGMAPVAAVPRRGRVVVDEDDEEEDDEDEDEGSMVDFIDRDDEDEEAESENEDGDSERTRGRTHGEDGDNNDDSGSSASDESGERYDVGPRTGAFQEAMTAARQGRADRFRQRREASQEHQINSRRNRNERDGRRDVPAGLAGMLDLMAEESDDGNLTDEGGVHEDDMVGLRGDYPGFSDLEEDGDDLGSESDVDDRSEEEYEDSFIDDEGEDEADEGSDELDSGDESEASVRNRSKKSKRSSRAGTVKSEDEQQSGEESDAPSLGELRRRRLKNLGGGVGNGQVPEVNNNHNADSPRRPNRSGSSRRAIIISDDEE